MSIENTEWYKAIEDVRAAVLRRRRQAIFDGVNCLHAQDEEGADRCRLLTQAFSDVLRDIENVALERLEIA